jgi:hypothetical protein
MCERGVSMCERDVSMCERGVSMCERDVLCLCKVSPPCHRILARSSTCRNNSTELLRLHKLF